MGWHRQDSYRHSFEDGPPRLLRFLIILFVLVGSLVAGVWYNTREIPRAAANEGRQPPSTPAR